MRAKKAIVAFRAGALPEIVENEITGIVCEPGAPARVESRACSGRLEHDLIAMGHEGLRAV